LLFCPAGAVSRFNSRHGHLFQNRNKSIACEENANLKELVRYIHLNPLRAGILVSMIDSNPYGWCGHSAGRHGQKHLGCQDVVDVLEWFGKTRNEAREACQEFVSKGIAQGRRPELVGRRDREKRAFSRKPAMPGVSRSSPADQGADERNRSVPGGNGHANRLFDFRGVQNRQSD
jgi:hypothetical protein